LTSFAAAGALVFARFFVFADLAISLLPIAARAVARLFIYRQPYRNPSHHASN
jgi:hypothetical protein